MTNGSRGERLHALDGLRGVMAMCVALYHYSVWAPWTRAGTQGNTLLAALGLYSVQGFFVLSGFCFYLLYRAQPTATPRALARFHLKRFFRIAPLYYLSLFVSLAMHITVGPEPTARMLLENMTFSFGFIHPNHALVAGGWSIGLEYVFYAVFPLFLWVARRPAGLVAMLLVACWCALQADQRVLEALPAERFHVYVQPENHAFLFVLGALLAELRVRVSWRLPVFVLPAVVAAASSALWFAAEPVPDHFDLVTGRARVIGALTCALLVACAGLSRPLPARLSRAYATLGELSFGVYMLHRVAYACVLPLLAGAAPPLVCFGALLLATIMAAFAYRLVELPLLRLGVRLAERIGDDGAELPAKPVTAFGPIAPSTADQPAQ